MRLPAEWECNGSVILSLPHPGTDWLPMLDEVRKCYVEIIKTLSAYCNLLIVTSDFVNDALCLNADASIDHSRLTYFGIETNDTWVRDYGFITTVDSQGKFYLNDFKFNGWGLKFAADKDNLVNRHIVKSLSHINGNYVNHLSFVLEGGSIESDGHGTLMTTSRCLLSPNRNGGMTKEEIGGYLTRCFNLQQILWLDHGALAGDDTDSHIDTLARFAPADTILYVATDNRDDEHYDELKAMEQQLRSFTTLSGKPYNLIPLPLPDPIHDEDGYRLPATYANFLITPGAVIVPTYGQPVNDKIAIERISTAFPGYETRGVDCNALIKQHGSLHCATMQIDDTVFQQTIESK